jgi:hypothetical protein
VYGEISKCRERVFCVGEMEKFLFVSFAWSLVVAARDFVRFVFGLVSELCGCRYWTLRLTNRYRTYAYEVCIEPATIWVFPLEICDALSVSRRAATCSDFSAVYLGQGSYLSQLCISVVCRSLNKPALVVCSCIHKRDTWVDFAPKQSEKQCWIRRFLVSGLLRNPCLILREASTAFLPILWMFLEIHWLN